MNKPTQRKNFLIALLIGALAVPLLALAANGLIEGNGSEDQAVDAASVPTRNLLSSPINKVVIDEVSAEDYLAAACGPDGQALVDAELNGSIDSIEQAALDALRPICEEAGMPLAEAAPVAPVVQRVVVVEPATPAVSTTAGTVPVDEIKTNDREDEEDSRDEEDEEDDR